MLSLLSQSCCEGNCPFLLVESWGCKGMIPGMPWEKPQLQILQFTFLLSWYWGRRVTVCTQAAPFASRPTDKGKRDQYLHCSLLVLLQRGTWVGAGGLSGCSGNPRVLAPWASACRLPWSFWRWWWCLIFLVSRASRELPILMVVCDVQAAARLSCCLFLGSEIGVRIDQRFWF